MVITIKAGAGRSYYTPRVTHPDIAGLHLLELREPVYIALYRRVRPEPRFANRRELQVL